MQTNHKFFKTFILNFCIITQCACADTKFNTTDASFACKTVKQFSDCRNEARKTIFLLLDEESIRDKTVRISDENKMRYQMGQSAVSQAIDNNLFSSDDSELLIKYVDCFNSGNVFFHNHDSEGPIAGLLIKYGKEAACKCLVELKKCEPSDRRIRVLCFIVNNSKEIDKQDIIEILGAEHELITTGKLHGSTNRE